MSLFGFFFPKNYQQENRYCPWRTKPSSADLVETKTNCDICKKSTSGRIHQRFQIDEIINKGGTIQANDYVRDSDLVECIKCYMGFSS